MLVDGWIQKLEFSVPARKHRPLSFKNRKKMRPFFSLCVVLSEIFFSNEQRGGWMFGEKRNEEILR